MSNAPRVVIDTSVLLSEHRHWMWLLASLGYYEGVWSPFIVGELVRIRTEHSIRRGVERRVYRERVNDLVHLLSDVLWVVGYRGVRVEGTLRDPDDEAVLATAVAGSADIVVSLNTRDFPDRGEVLGVRYITPKDFLAYLETVYTDEEIVHRAGTASRRLP